ncbi:SAM-dependent methyltransferase [Achromobacter sp. RW408]|uniref:N-6 DNA methylase n=1 Tax=Achromobacter sp. RW408 TaxID=2202897 RepID=UPI000D737E59|nr:class I SAM-dependent methyltransferase [Achromobacter sp. RW408]PWY42207.1 SAM-dependent methyltransferase [Achromobacter sp. RW408]
MNFIENESEQKLRGGYYTPEDLATFIAKWVARNSPIKVLEPSCGDGVFIKAFHNANYTEDLHFHGFELFACEAQKAKKIGAQLNVNCSIKCADFLDHAIESITAGKYKYDAVVGNPPFIRYQYLSTESQEKSEVIFKSENLKFTKHTNAWVPFVIASIKVLKPGGRLGMVLPAEIIHVMHAQSLRTFLGEQCSKLLIIDPEEIWFENTLQGAVILFAEKKKSIEDHSYGLGIYKVTGRNFLKEDPEGVFLNTPRINGETVEGKWTQALLTDEERTLYKALLKLDDVHKFRDIAKVDVGIVTGANKFFLVPDTVVQEFGLEKYAHPMFGRSEHCPGLIYDDKQHRENSEKKHPTNFIFIQNEFPSLPERVREYIASGERESLHTRYKCRIRKPWYSVPSVYATEIGMLKRSHDIPKLVLNKMQAYTTDTAYRITVKKDIAADKLVFCFVTALTALSAELEGRHYGGGVLELVPSEIEELAIAYPKELMEFDLEALNLVYKERSAIEVLEKQSRVVLGALGVTIDEQAILLSAWKRLKNRRQRIGE